MRVKAYAAIGVPGTQPRPQTPGLSPLGGGGGRVRGHAGGNSVRGVAECKPGAWAAPCVFFPQCVCFKPAHTREKRVRPHKSVTRSAPSSSRHAKTLGILLFVRSLRTSPAEREPTV
jgi:hypothetical protein